MDEEVFQGVTAFSRLPHSPFLVFVLFPSYPPCAEGLGPPGFPLAYLACALGSWFWNFSASRIWLSIPPTRTFFGPACVRLAYCRSFLCFLPKLLQCVNVQLPCLHSSVPRIELPPLPGGHKPSLRSLAFSPRCSCDLPGSPTDIRFCFGEEALSAQIAMELIPPSFTQNLSVSTPINLVPDPLRSRSDGTLPICRSQLSCSSHCFFVF